MTIDKKILQEWEENMLISLSKSQETAILARFTVEPEPYTWSEQDIYEQIRSFVDKGFFVKPATNFNAEAPSLPPGIEF